MGALEKVNVRISCSHRAGCWNYNLGDISTIWGDSLESRGKTLDIVFGVEESVLGDEEVQKRKRWMYYRKKKIITFSHSDNI